MEYIKDQVLGGERLGEKFPLNRLTRGVSNADRDMGSAHKKRTANKWVTGVEITLISGVSILDGG